VSVRTSACVLTDSTNNARAARLYQPDRQDLPGVELSLILILLATVVGLAALGLTPREEDPQIVVPLADVYVNFPGHSAAEVEQLVTTPLEKILYQIDGVEYVYSMSRENQAIITVRYYVGEDRERSLVKLYKKLDENLDIVPARRDRLGRQAGRDRRRADWSR
jgi:multidrug efflux pump subunit AcrB